MPLLVPYLSPRVLSTAHLCPGAAPHRLSPPSVRRTREPHGETDGLGKALSPGGSGSANTRPQKDRHVCQTCLQCLEDCRVGQSTLGSPLQPGDAGLRETPVNVMQRLKDATEVFLASTVPNLSQKRRCPTSCRSIWPTPSTCQPSHLNLFSGPNAAGPTPRKG